MLSVPESLPAKLIGLTEEEALKLINDEGHCYFVSRRDKTIYYKPPYYLPTQVSLCIDNGKVSGADIG